MTKRTSSSSLLSSTASDSAPHGQGHGGGLLGSRAGEVIRKHPHGPARPPPFPKTADTSPQKPHLLPLSTASDSLLRSSSSSICQSPAVDEQFVMKWPSSTHPLLAQSQISLSTLSRQPSWQDKIATGRLQRSFSTQVSPETSLPSSRSRTPPPTEPDNFNWRALRRWGSGSE